VTLAQTTDVQRKLAEELARKPDFRDVVETLYGRLREGETAQKIDKVCLTPKAPLNRKRPHGRSLPWRQSLPLSHAICQLPHILLGLLPGVAGQNLLVDQESRPNP
jgi:hypothetical protein